MVLAVVGLQAWKGYQWDLALNGPFCFSDELIYKQNAQAINRTDGSTYNPQYPPGYPLLLSVALKFEEWYLAILVTNALLTGLSVLLTCWPGGFFPRGGLSPLLPCLPCPPHSVSPVMVLSENLAVPVLMGSVYALVTLQRDSPAWRHAVFGPLCLANWAVKFIGLVQVPPLALAWIYLAGRRGFLRVPSILSGLAGGLLVLLLWLALGQSHGLTLKQTFLGPFDVAALPLDLGLLLSWLILYAAYIFLAAGPLLPLILCTLLTRGSYGGIRETAIRQDFRLLLLLFLSLAACLIFASAPHSTLALYNQSQPQYLLGRHLVTVTPPGLLVGAVALYAIRLRGCLPPAAAAGALLLWLPAAGLSHSVLSYDRLGLGLSPYFTALPFNTPEIGALHTRGGFWLLRAIGAGSLVLVAARAGHRRLGQAAAAAAVLGSGCWLMISSSPVAGKTWEMGSAGVHARMLANRLQETPWISDRAVGVQIGPAVPNVQRSRRMGETLRFWGVCGDIATEPDCSVDTSEIKVGIALEARCSSSTTYLANGRPVSICIEEGDSNPEPCILDYGPRMAEAGTVFNPQAHGLSGLWFKIRNITPATELLFNELLLKPTVRRSDLATAAMPPSAYPAPGTYPMRFRDPETLVESNVVFLEVK